MYKKEKIMPLFVISIRVWQEVADSLITLEYIKSSMDYNKIFMFVEIICMTNIIVMWDSIT